MSKWLRFCRKRLIMAAACGLGLLACEVREASAGIVIEMSLNGGVTFTDLAAFTTPLLTDPLQLQNYGTVNLDLLNTFLGASGSAYQFTALGGSSNWAGQPDGGALSITGGIEIPAGAAGTNTLLLRETEAGFTSPSGPAGTLLSASTATFSGAEKGNLHTASSSFNLLSTPLYQVLSNGTFPNNQGGNQMAAIPAFVTPYTLDNEIRFGLIGSPKFSPTDNFGLAAAATVIPEPASVVVMMIGLPVPLVGLAWLRRRRALAARA
jgi:hypothetical protein